MTKLPFKAAASPKIATRAELDALRGARPKSRPVQELTPPSLGGAEIRRTVNELAESRIKLLENRLEETRNRFRQGHAKALIRGKAARDFGR
ncbi:MAG: hypothetical protein AAF724_14910 [Pseudomonadota bacterium]